MWVVPNGQDGTVSEPDHPTARRRRRRATSGVGPPPTRPTASAGQASTTEAADVASPAEPPPTPSGKSSGKSSGSVPTKRPAKRGRSDPGERGLHSLVGAGPSQLGVEGALRGRDVNRPTDEDLAEAERDLVIVRRHWKPPI